jgi:hypothetical protein
MHVTAPREPSRWPTPKPAPAAVPPAARALPPAAPKYSTTLVDPFRDYLRHRRAQEPAVPTWTLLGEIKAMGHDDASSAEARMFHGD